MEKTLEEMQNELIVLTERNRILVELNKKELPAGTWTAIKDIILPPPCLTQKQREINI